jgi:hypothetical protein
MGRMLFQQPASGPGCAQQYGDAFFGARIFISPPCDFKSAQSVYVHAIECMLPNEPLFFAGPITATLR